VVATVKKIIPITQVADLEIGRSSLEFKEQISLDRIVTTYVEVASVSHKCRCQFEAGVRDAPEPEYLVTFRC
jgi:hypothetical protein